MKQFAIGVLDSGIGGFSVVKEMNLPAAELRGIYYPLKQTNLLTG